MWVAIGGFVAMLLGLLMPWASVTLISVNGIDTDDGKLFGVGVVVGILVFWASYRRPQIRPVVALLVGGFFVCAVYEIVDVARASASFGTATIHASPGAGLYLDAAGAAAVGIAQAIAWRNRRGALPE